MPKQGEYAETLNSRLPAYVNKKKVTEVMKMDTVFLLRKTLSTIISNETYAECLRQRLQTRPGFSVYKAFKALDKHRNGYASIEDLKSLLSRHGYKLSQKELLGLMNRFDKNQDGRISYNEFVDEIRPKV